MKRVMLMGCLVVGCATAGPQGDEELFKPGGSKGASATPVKVEMPLSAEARIDPIGNSKMTGFGRFGVDRGVVTMDLTFTNVPQGQHAVTLQDSCDGEHWNPTSAKHGRFDSPPFHLGDVGNFFANDTGHGSITFSTELWSVGTGLSNDVVGKFIVVRAERDDFHSQPNGGAGALLGCGRIDLSQMTKPAVSMTGRLIESQRR